MSTNCTIKIQGVNYAKIYKHWDGYPEATLHWLENFNKFFYEKRGDDPEYKFAQLLRSSINDSDVYSLDKSKVTGWGVIDYHAETGAEYEYNLKTDGTVVYKEI